LGTAFGETAAEPKMTRINFSNALNFVLLQNGTHGREVAKREKQDRMIAIVNIEPTEKQP